MKDDEGAALRSRSRTRGTTRPRRCCCACCAAPARAASPGCGRAAATCCGRCSSVSRARGARAPARARASRGARIPRTPTRRTCATACATSCCRTSSSASTRASARRSPGPPRSSPTRPPTSRRRPEELVARIGSRDGEALVLDRRRLGRGAAGRGPGGRPAGLPADGRPRRDRPRTRRPAAAGRALGGARRPAPAAFRAAGKPASLTGSSGSKSVPSGPRKPYHRPGPTDEGQDLRAVHGGADRPARGRAGRGDHARPSTGGRSASSA